MADRLFVQGSRGLTAVVVGLLFMVPYLLLVVVEYIQAGPLEVENSIRKHHRVNLFRKYLNYSAASRMKVPVQDIIGAMESDIPSLARDGYYNVFELIRNF